MEGIPTLVVLDEQFKVITTEGTAAVISDAEAARFPWRPQPLEALSPFTAGRINSGPTLLLIVDMGDDDAAEAFAKEVLLGVATATKAAPGGEDWAFLWARRGNEIAQSVLAFTGFIKDEEAEAPAGHLAVITDVPQQAMWDLKATGVEVSAVGLGSVVSDFKAGKLGPGKKLGGDDE